MAELFKPTDRVRARIKRAVTWHEQNFHGKWQRYIDLYACRHYPDVVSDQERIAVSITFSIVNVIVPAVAHNYPVFTVTARKEEYEDAAVIAERVINTSWRQLNVQEEVRDALKDSIICGTGVVKCGWRRIEKDVRRSKKVIKRDYEKKLKERDEALESAWSAGDASPKDFPNDEEVWLSIPSTEKAVTHDDLFVERVSPKDFFVDPDATDDRDWSYVFQRVVKPYDEVINNSLYDPKVLAKLRPDTKSQAFEGDLGDDRKDDAYREDILRVTLYEYWDVHNQTFAVYAENCEEPLRGPEKWPYDFLPFYVFRNNTVPDEFWAMGEVEAIESQQHELNKTRSQMLNQRRQYNRKVLFRNGAFAAQHLDELRSDRDGVFVPVKGNVPLNEAIYVLQPPQIDAQLYQFEEVIKDDINRVSTVSEYQQGQLPDIRRTATEASLIESSSSIRAQDKLARVERFMADIAHGMLALMQEFYTQDHAVRVLGANGAVMWFDFNGDLIYGEYDLQVEAGSTQPSNEALVKQDAIQLMTALAGHPNVNQIELLKHLFKAFKIRNFEKWIQEMPVDPMLAQLAGGAAPGEEEQGGAAEGPPTTGPEGENATPPVDGGKDVGALLAQLTGQVPVQGVPA